MPIPPRRHPTPRPAAGDGQRRPAGSTRAAGAAAALLLVLLPGCGAPLEREATRPPSSAGGRLRVVTTVLPLTLFTRTLAGDCAEVRSLVPAGRDPHALLPSPTDLTRLRQADLLVINGLGMEPYRHALLGAVANPRLRVIDASRGITPLPLLEHGPPPPPPVPPLPGATAPPVNPHVWLDPLLAARQVHTIADALSRAAPACRRRIQARSQAVTAELERFDARTRQRLAPFAGRGFVTFHAIAPYFARRYRLRASAAVDLPGRTPTPADLARVSRLVRQEGLHALLDEPQAGHRVFSALAHRLGVQVLEFDPIETGPLDADRRPGFFIERMRRNVDHLLIALGG